MTEEKDYSEEIIKETLNNALDQQVNSLKEKIE